MTAPYAWVTGAISAGAEIVTANRRLSRELRNAYDRQQLLSGKKSWRTPRILSWDAWLNVLLDDTESSVAIPLCLDAQASAILWERQLADAAGPQTLSLNRLVPQLRQTWQRLQEWCIPVADLHRYASNDDERLFASAASRYQSELAANSWIDNAQRASFIVERMHHGDVKVPARLVHAGFDRLTPTADKLLQAFKDSDCKVTAAPAPDHRQMPAVVSFGDEDAELRAAGLWARQQLAVNEAARVAIVCPALEQDAARKASLVREGLAPGWQHAGSRHKTAVNVSYGKPLSGYPMVAVALLWLKWVHHGLSSREVSVLLRSPLAGAGATDGCSRLELVLRQMPDRSWTAASLVPALSGRDGSAEAATWLAGVERIAASQFENRGRDSPAAWANKIDLLLQQLAWPGNKPPDTLEFQLFNRWRELLNEFSRIDVVRPQLGFLEAIARLTTLAAETVYQPETTPGMVQLLGSLEAAGMEFDHVLVSGLHALQWPPPAHPLPLVSRALQRQAGMPDATPADTLEFSRRTLARLAASAPSVVLSWPEADPESVLAPSPLLAPYAGQPAAVFRDPGWYASQLSGQAAVEHVLHDPAPPVQTGERVHGGAYTVQRQADEPLSAFVYGRLGVSDLQKIETGLSVQVRGSIIHEALHRLMVDEPSSADVANWSASERGTRIDRSIDAALARHERHADGVLRRLLAIERARLCVLLQTFVMAEIERPHFIVESVEASLQYVSHGVHLDLRVDRIDRLADGTLLIIDYKTGAVKNLLNQAGEPKELQLVVYACAIAQENDGNTGREIGGLALVNVDSRGTQYKATGGSVGWNRLGPELWEERLRSWKKAVDETIAELAAGDVRIDTAMSTDKSRRLNVLSRVEELKREL